MKKTFILALVFLSVLPGLAATKPKLSCEYFLASSKFVAMDGVITTVGGKNDIELLDKCLSMINLDTLKPCLDEEFVFVKNSPPYSGWSLKSLNSAIDSDVTLVNVSVCGNSTISGPNIYLSGYMKSMIVINEGSNLSVNGYYSAGGKIKSHNGGSITMVAKGKIQLEAEGVGNEGIGIESTTTTDEFKVKAKGGIGISGATLYGDVNIVTTRAYVSFTDFDLGESEDKPGRFEFTGLSIGIVNSKFGGSHIINNGDVGFNNVVAPKGSFIDSSSMEYVQATEFITLSPNTAVHNTIVNGGISISHPCTKRGAVIDGVRASGSLSHTFQLGGYNSFGAQYYHGICYYPSSEDPLFECKEGGFECTALDGI